MKTLIRLLLAGISLATIASAVRADLSAPAWLETYYLNPQPALVSDSIEDLSRSGYFDRPQNIAVAIGFFAALFERHPDRVDAWLRPLGSLPLAHRRLLAAALWQAGDPSAESALRLLIVGSPVRAEVEKLASIPGRTVNETAVLSPASMRLRWGAYLATGDERHILSILDAFGLDQPALSSAARMALAQIAAAHPRVMEICRTQLDRQPDEIRGELRAALQLARGMDRPRS